MLKRTQKEHLIHVSDIGLGSDVLLASGFCGTEGISDLFSFEVTLLSSNVEIQPEQIIGKDITVTIQDGNERKFHGYISCFVFDEMVASDLRRYKITMVPWLWFLSQTNNNRIFQHKNTKEIVTQVFQNLGFQDFEFHTAGGSPREYCVQYDESDLTFLHRLLAEDGISYFFKHTEGKHQLVLVDSSYAFEACSDVEIEYSMGSSLNAQVSRWEHQHHFRKGVWSLNDYDFNVPNKNLNAQITTLSQFQNNVNYEHYEYPNLYNRNLGQVLVKMRMEAEEAKRHCVEADSNYSSLYVGGHFKLGKHTTESEKQNYILTSITHTAVDETYINKNKKSKVGYRNTFTCIPDGIPICPPPKSRPVMRGPQTAIVVGPVGEEIYTDDLGRIKVQFIWDREGQMNESSTCFLRVAQTWAGNKWGASFIPRIGHEVVVDFYDGDPDRPFVNGSVYNGKNKSPYTSKTLSGIKSRSTKGGTPQNSNEIRFDDKKDSEQMFFQAEKDQDIVVKNNRREHVFNDRHKTIEKDQYEITKGHHHIVTGKDRLEEVQSSSFFGVARDYVSKVGQNVMRIIGGGEVHRVMGSRTREVMGSEGIDVKKSRSVIVGAELFHKGPNLVYQGEEEITIKGPGGFIKIDASGVTIVGNKVKINEGGSAGVAETVAGSQPNEPEKPRVADVAVDGR